MEAVGGPDDLAGLDDSIHVQRSIDMRIGLTVVAYLVDHGACDPLSVDFANHDVRGVLVPPVNDGRELFQPRAVDEALVLQRSAEGRAPVFAGAKSLGEVSLVHDMPELSDDLIVSQSEPCELTR
jgi:hypothetical protein